MPITTSAKKALRQSLRRREQNLARKSALKKIIKNFEKLARGKKIEEAKSFFPRVQQALDKAVKQRILKKNNASRNKSRLSKAFK
ncbi:MAG: 30S ribosomal protein S20 [Patescibacteria group bacterium]